MEWCFQGWFGSMDRVYDIQPRRLYRRIQYDGLSFDFTYLASVGSSELVDEQGRG
jgi:hypothetical protein